MSNKIFLNLKILDFDCSPDAITTIVGIEPTRTWVKGSPREKYPTMINKESGWELSSGIDERANFEDHISAILKILRSHLDGFLQVCSKYYTELQCAIYMHDEESTPWIHFTKDVWYVFQKLSIEVDFDLILLSANAKAA